MRVDLVLRADLLSLKVSSTAFLDSFLLAPTVSSPSASFEVFLFFFADLFSFFDFFVLIDVSSVAPFLGTEPLSSISSPSASFEVFLFFFAALFWFFDFFVLLNVSSVAPILGTEPSSSIISFFPASGKTFFLRDELSPRLGFFSMSITSSPPLLSILFLLVCGIATETSSIPSKVTNSGRCLLPLEQLNALSCALAVVSSRRSAPASGFIPRAKM
uniref:Uncharacterized protein n=1 Tax=Oryza glumipatula TaxID=40148 RepID=A0A0E0BI91_9ORYZ